MKKKITAIFMGEFDRQANRWFPVKKMTWDSVLESGDCNKCRIEFLTGAKNLCSFYDDPPLPYRDLSRVIESSLLSKSIWKRRSNKAMISNVSMMNLLGVDPKSFYRWLEAIEREGGYLKGDLNHLFVEREADEDGFYRMYFRPVNSWSLLRGRGLDFEATFKGLDVNIVSIGGKNKLVCRQQVIGNCPYHIQDLYKRYGEMLKIQVLHVNQETGLEYQVICVASLSEHVGKPFSSEEYRVYHG